MDSLRELEYTELHRELTMDDSRAIEAWLKVRTQRS